MIGIDTLLRRAGLPLLPQSIGSCAVCRKPVRQGQAHLCVRGLLVHRECATYRMRREDERGPFLPRRRTP